MNKILIIVIILVYSIPAFTQNIDFVNGDDVLTIITPSKVHSVHLDNQNVGSGDLVFISLGDFKKIDFSKLSDKDFKRFMYAVDKEKIARKYNTGMGDIIIRRLLCPAAYIIVINLT
jgi:hypothetical protein